MKPEVENYRAAAEISLQYPHPLPQLKAEGQGLAGSCVRTHPRKRAGQESVSSPILTPL